MTGGMLRVPKEETESFFAAYIDAILTGKLYLVEKITPMFRFFVDLDWISPTKPDPADVIRRSNEAIPGKILAALTPAKDRDGVPKYGMHLHWPDLIVNRSEALRLREQLPSDIRKFADTSVYSTGLRMLWSHKKDGSLPYVPYGAPSPDVNMLRAYSIRVSGETKAPDPEPTDDPLLQFVRRYIPGQQSVVFKKRKKYRDTITIETNSRFCERIGKEHRSNHVSFVVERGTVRQRCFDEDCKGHESKRYILSRSVLDALKSAVVPDGFGSGLAID